MGNAIQNASDAVNPTYSWKFNENSQEISLVTKDNTCYDFEELDYHSVEEAKKKFPIYRNGMVKYYESEIGRLIDELGRARAYLRIVRDSATPEIK